MITKTRLAAEASPLHSAAGMRTGPINGTVQLTLEGAPAVFRDSGFDLLVARAARAAARGSRKTVQLILDDFSSVTVRTIGELRKLPVRVSDAHLVDMDNCACTEFRRISRKDGSRGGFVARDAFAVGSDIAPTAVVMPGSLVEGSVLLAGSTVCRDSILYGAMLGPGAVFSGQEVLLFPGVKWSKEDPSKPGIAMSTDERLRNVMARAFAPGTGAAAWPRTELARMAAGSAHLEMHSVPSTDDARSVLNYLVALSERAAGMLRKG